MTDSKVVHLKMGEELTIVTPHGSIDLKTDQAVGGGLGNVMIWIWDNDQFPSGTIQPEVIDIRGRKCLFAVLTSHMTKPTINKEEFT